MNTTGKSSVIRVGQYKRYFESIEKDLLRTKNHEDVKIAMEVMAARRSNQWKWSKDKQFMLDAGIPNIWAFHPAFSRHSLETMTKEEKRDYMAAYKSIYKKMST